MAISPFPGSSANHIPDTTPLSISFQDWQVRLQSQQERVSTRSSHSTRKEQERVSSLAVLFPEGRNHHCDHHHHHHQISTTTLNHPSLAIAIHSQPQSPPITTTSPSTSTSSSPLFSTASSTTSSSSSYTSTSIATSASSDHSQTSPQLDHHPYLPRFSPVTRYSSSLVNQPIVHDKRQTTTNNNNTFVTSSTRQHHVKSRDNNSKNVFARLGYFEPSPRKSLSLDTISIISTSSILITSDHDFVPTEPIINTPIIKFQQPAQTSNTTVRSLTLPMSAAVASANSGNHAGSELPGSPPELTDSKSSKSSSFHSCGLPDSNAGELSNFEDISLEEVASIHEAGKSVHNITSTAAQFYRYAPQSNKTVRDLTHSSTRPVSNLANGLAATSSSRDSKYQLPVPGPRSSRNKPRQTSQVSLHTQSQNLSRSRSPSPSSAISVLRTFSPTSTSLPTSHSSGTRPTNFALPAFQHRKRQPLQPRKKSVQELEKEFDELDDELPDDAVIYNVPISPRPAHERGLSSASTVIVEASSLPNAILSPSSGHDRSGQSSPERRSPRHHWSNHGVPIGFVEPSPTSPGLSDVSADFTRPVSATKSRGAVFGDLNKEARELTHALELYADESAIRYEQDIQSGRISPPKSSALSPTSSISVDLPPIRKSDPLIDPLPVSREKEQFLTRTRPSWLPPKSQKEEKKHLKEYQKLMARAAHAEQKAAHKAQKLQLERDNATSERAKKWETKILPNWDRAVTESKTKDLWWSGLPTQLRGQIWSKAVGNELGLTSTSFEATLSRVGEIETSLEGLSLEDKLRDPLGYLFSGLKEDASTVFPELNLFQEGGPLHDSLLAVCKAFAMYRSNIEWDYGIMTLVALLLVNMQPADAFITLANIFNRSLPSAVLTHDPMILTTTYNTILAMIAFKRPQLHSHLITLQNLTADGQPIWDHASVTASISPTAASSQESASLPPRPRSPTPSPGPLLDPAVYLFPILHGLCTASPRLSIESISRIWDVVVFEGDVALVRAAVAVVGRLESKLYCQPQEILNELDKPDWDIGDTDSFMQYVRSMETMIDDI